MPINYKDISELTEETNIAGTEKVPVSGTKYVIFNKIKDWIINSLKTTGLDLGGKEVKNAGFEVVTTLPTTNNFVGRQVTYQGRSYIWDGSDWVTPNDVYEANLKWGGRNISGGYSPIDAAMVDELGANRLAFAKPAGITIEYSTDGGATWLDYGASDSVKNLLTASATALITGKSSSNLTASPLNMLRVTFDTGVCNVYTILNKIVLNVTTNGSQGSYVTIQKALQSTPDNYINHVENIPISGWSGYNVINIPNLTTYGNSPTIHYGRLRFIFGCTGYSGTSSSHTGLRILSIKGFGGAGWATPSNMAKRNSLFTYDGFQNATFPALLKAVEGFNKIGSSDSYVLLGGGGHKLISDISNKLTNAVTITNFTTFNPTTLGMSPGEVLTFYSHGATNKPSWSSSVATGIIIHTYSGYYKYIAYPASGIGFAVGYYYSNNFQGWDLYDAQGLLDLVKTVDGTGSGLDSDLLDGKHASDFATSTHNHDTAYLGITATAADSDKLGGKEGSEFASADHNHDYNLLDNLPAIYNANHDGVPTDDFDSLYDASNDVWLCPLSMCNGPLNNDGGTNPSYSTSFEQCVVQQFGLNDKNTKVQVLYITTGNVINLSKGSIFYRMQGDKWKRIFSYSDIDLLTEKLDPTGTEKFPISSTKFISLEGISKFSNAYKIFDDLDGIFDANSILEDVSYYVLNSTVNLNRASLPAAIYGDGNANNSIISPFWFDSSIIKDNANSIQIKQRIVTSGVSVTDSVDNRQNVIAKCYIRVTTPLDPGYWTPWQRVLTSYDEYNGQADWNQTDQSQKNYIKNKPDIIAINNEVDNSESLDDITNAGVYPLVYGREYLNTPNPACGTMSVRSDLEGFLIVYSKEQTISQQIHDTINNKFYIRSYDIQSSKWNYWEKIITCKASSGEQGRSPEVTDTGFDLDKQETPVNTFYNIDTSKYSKDLAINIPLDSVDNYLRDNGPGAGEFKITLMFSSPIDNPALVFSVPSPSVVGTTYTVNGTDPSGHQNISGLEILIKWYAIVGGFLFSVYKVNIL